MCVLHRVNVSGIHTTDTIFFLDGVEGRERLCRFMLCRLNVRDLGTKDLKFIPYMPVKVGLRYTEVSNLLFRLEMQISRKLSWLLFSSSQVN